MTDHEPRPTLRRAPDADLHPAAPPATPHVVPPLTTPILPGQAAGFGTASETFAVAATPKPSSGEGPKVTVKVKLPKKLHKRLRRQASDEGVSLSSLVTRLLDR